MRAERTLGCSFQAANTADFSDAVTLYTVGNGGETKYSLTNGWQEVSVGSAQSFTYLRFYAPIGKAGGSIAEVEFYGQTWAVRDLWRQKDEGVFDTSYSVSVPGHATHLVKLTPQKGAGLLPGVRDIRR